MIIQICMDIFRKITRQERRGLPREIYISPQEHPDLTKLLESHPFFIVTIHSVPFYLDKELKKDQYRAIW